MVDSEKINALLKRNDRVNFNLKDVKKLNDEDINNRLGLKTLLKNIDDFYICKINEKISNLKISELKKDKISNNLKKKKNILYKILNYSSATFLLSLLSFILTGLVLNSNLLLNINTIVCFTSLFVFIPCLLLEIKCNKLILKRSEEKLFEDCLSFNDVVREITIETVNEIKKVNGMSTEKNKENLISFLVEENYFLEKNKKNSIFKKIKDKVLTDIVENNINPLESKNLKNEEKTLEGQFNFLLEKNQNLIEKNKNNILN